MQETPGGYGHRTETYAQGGAPPAYGRPVYGRERDFGLSVLLAVVTLGIYHYVYHWKVHDELSKQLGRANDSVVWFVLYIVSAFLAGPLAVIFFVLYVMNQYKAIEDARSRLGLRSDRGQAYFLTWYILGFVGTSIAFGVAYFALLFAAFDNALPPALVLLMVGTFIFGVVSLLAAYNGMVTAYNEIWRALQHGQTLQTDAEFHGWGGGHPQPYGQPSGQAHAPGPAQPAYGQEPHPQAAPPSAPSARHGETYGGYRSSSWDAPGRSGFDIRSRSAGGPPGGTPIPVAVEQAFQCPRCHAHITARGEPGGRVEIQCTNCGETGTVALPR